MVKVHQSSVDTYLEDMILLSMDVTADNQAREEVQVLAEQINDIAYEMEDKLVNPLTFILNRTWFQRETGPRFQGNRNLLASLTF